MSKFLLNLLLQISKALVNSKIQLLIQKFFFSWFRPGRPCGPPGLSAQPAHWPCHSSQAESICEHLQSTRLLLLLLSLRWCLATLQNESPPIAMYICVAKRPHKRYYGLYQRIIMYCLCWHCRGILQHLYIRWKVSLICVGKLQQIYLAYNNAYMCLWRTHWQLTTIVCCNI
jgi:hypothetical protein